VHESAPFTMNKAWTHPTYAPYGVATNDSRLFYLQFEEWRRLTMALPGSYTTPIQSSSFSITQLNIKSPRDVHSIESVLDRNNFHCKENQTQKEMIEKMADSNGTRVEDFVIVADCTPTLFAVGYVELHSQKFSFQRILGGLEDAAQSGFVGLAVSFSACSLFWTRLWRVKVMAVIAYIITVLEAYLFCTYLTELNAISGIGMVLALSHCPPCISHLANVYAEQLGAQDRLDWSSSLVIPALCQSSFLAMLLMLPLFLSPWPFLVKHLLPSFFICFIVILANASFMLPGLLAICNADLAGESVHAKRTEMERLMAWQRPGHHRFRLHQHANSRKTLNAPVMEAIRSVKSSLSASQSRDVSVVNDTGGVLPSLLTEEMPKSISSKVEV